ncbi:MAG TPA: peptide chain release factor N(5)-glutamine methyltransferase [Thermoanaerobaculia bacterium]|nr:peptide chain release factor N(5)-glutamine methyltransferase [Thermoanaerobaculia bacterium]
MSWSTEPAEVGQLLDRARARLREAPHQPSPREALLLLGHVLGCSEAQVLARSREPLECEPRERFESLLERRLAGEPMAYLKGRREFYGREFGVDSRTLIPRPETEHLVEAALALPLPAAPRILDLGTGSGILAITLAAELPQARVVAVDLSLDALAVARANARMLGPGRVALAATDLASALELGAFDLVVSNPPYVALEEAVGLSPEVRDYEPGLALFATEGGLAIHRRLLERAAGLRPGAFLAFEIGDGQLEGVLALAEPQPVELVEARKDYASKPRVVVLKRT